MIGNPTEGLKQRRGDTRPRARRGRMIGNPTEGLKPSWPPRQPRTPAAE